MTKRANQRGASRLTRAMAGMMLSCLMVAGVAAACTPTTTPTTPTGWQPGDDTISFNEGDAAEGEVDTGVTDLRAMSMAVTNPGVASITRDDIEARGRTWLNNTQITYSQTKYWTNALGTYRRDCSGFVSMALGLKTSLDTSALTTVGTNINYSDLRKGDYLIKLRRYAADGTIAEQGHARLFIGWDDAAHTRFTVWEQTGSNHPHASSGQTVTGSINGRYKAYRYNHVVESGPATPPVDPDMSPTGALDVVSGGVGTATASGWALDMSNSSTAIQVQIFRDLQLVTTVTANQSRPDVAAVLGVPAARGFTASIPATAGQHWITAKAMNIGTGADAVIGNKSVIVSSPTPAGLTVAGSNYEGPGYVCSTTGATGSFFGATLAMPSGYPAGAWRQIGKSLTGNAQTLTLYEGGIPLNVPLGSICDARHDPSNPSRTAIAGSFSLTPVAANYTGTGYICNPSGSYGRNGGVTQPFLPSYNGQVGPWDANNMAVYYNGTPFLVPRPDVCPMPAPPVTTTTTAPPALSVVGAGYEGPGYVCASGGTNGEFFGTTKFMANGYPAGAWRQIGPQINGDPNTLTLYENGVPLKVPLGSICDARHDPSNPSRTAIAGSFSLNPVAAGYTGTGYICNPSGSLGRNGTNTQTFLPSYQGQVGPWDANNVAVYYNGTPWLVSRPDVCPV